LLPLLKIRIMFFAISPVQILVIALVVLLLFGGRKIPELMKGLGTGIKEFKNATKQEEKDNDNQEN
jgi:sec-independent protein translocase protein TatA